MYAGECLVTFFRFICTSHVYFAGHLFTFNHVDFLSCSLSHFGSVIIKWHRDFVHHTLNDAYLHFHIFCCYHFYTHAFFLSEEIIKMLSYCIELISYRHDKFNFVVDLANLSLTSIDDRMIRMMMQIIELNYPGSIEQIAVTNVPFWVKGLYAVVKSWVDPKWRNVLGLHSNYDYLPQVFGQNAVPTRFKGRASNDLCAEWFVKERMSILFLSLPHFAQTFIYSRY